ncbi:cytochrome c5 [Oleiagrimonas soli]|uniref:Cytochrome c5 n=1 Tax=Oleiagrimonas soli TaxID=1543381 RepID=A0A841KRM3_9GAMM|nr:cytochrome c5 [Oleiagrimonas soli]
MSGPISKSDQSFLRQFSMVIFFLVLVALVLIFLAWHIYSDAPKDEVPGARQVTEQRIAPVGGVYAGKSGFAAMQAAQEAAAKAAAAQVAYGGTTDGKTIYGQLCHSCHTAGVAGAPKLGDKANWAPRIAQGIDTLIKHAEQGYTGPDGNHMPARGGNPSLSDAQVAATVKWMVSQSK